MEAGGAISGANFGLYYTVMMQLGYNYFGKKAIQQVQEGRPISSILLDISKELAPFNEMIIQRAFDMLPSIIELTAKAGIDFVTDLVTGKTQGAISGTTTSAENIEWFKNIMKLITEGFPQAGDSVLIPPSEESIGPIQPQVVEQSLLFWVTHDDRDSVSKKDATARMWFEVGHPGKIWIRKQYIRHTNAGSNVIYVQYRVYYS